MLSRAEIFSSKPFIDLHDNHDIIEKLSALCKHFVAE